MAVKWLADPEDHDYAAAVEYLSLTSEADEVSRTVDALKVCASYLTDENTPIPCRLVSWQS